MLATGAAAEGKCSATAIDPQRRLPQTSHAVRERRFGGDHYGKAGLWAAPRENSCKRAPPSYRRLLRGPVHHEATLKKLVHSDGRGSF